MESKSNTPSSESNYTEPRKSVPMYLIAIVITLSVVAILLAIMLYVKSDQHKENLQYVEVEKQKLEIELNELIVEYDSLKIDSDSLVDQLGAEQDKIRQLLKREASSATKLRMYTRELETLRKVMRSYIVQIDSLNTRNQELTDENIMVRGELQQVSSDFEEVTKQRDELTSTVKQAKQLIAKNIISVGLNESSKEKDKIKKIAKIRVSFTVLENNVADAGSKTIYLRIVRPDEKVLSSPDNGMFQYDGESLDYSEKRVIDYEKSDLDVTIYWDLTDELIAGIYFADLYAEGYKIGSHEFALK